MTETAPLSPVHEAADSDDDHIDGKGPAVKVRGLVSAFGDNVIHDGLDLTARHGEVLGVVGGSGAGKSVLLNTIIGLRSPQGGSVRVFGQDIEHASRRRWTNIELLGRALPAGRPVLEPHRTRERRGFDLRAHRHGEVRRLRSVRLQDRPRRGWAPRPAIQPSELSGGMRKRAGLARALALDPELVFLDEPTAGLDPISAAAFDELIKDLSDSLDLTVFMITHDLDTLYEITDRVAVIADKKVVATAPGRELEHADHPSNREYFPWDLAAGPRPR